MYLLGEHWDTPPARWLPRYGMDHSRSMTTSSSNTARKASPHQEEVQKYLCVEAL
jgi:hypothetical protein